MDRKDHPVWDVYDLYRTARLNIKYYSERLTQIERCNFVLEVLIAATTSSTVAALWFWNSEYGEISWKYLGAVAAVATILKPLLAFPRKIKAYETVLSGYRALEHDLHEITTSISQEQKYDQAARSEFKKAMKRKGILVSNNPEIKENKKIKRKCEAEVIEELPADSFYIPEEN